MPVKRELRVTVRRRGGVDRDAVVERIVRRVATEIMSTRLVNTLRLVVECRATLGSGIHGKAIWSPVIDARRKEYRIVVRRDASLEDMAKTIAHEVRHVEQFARGRLRAGKLGGVPGWFWRPGTGRAKHFPHATTAYWTSPWEVEARESEVLGPKALPRVPRKFLVEKFTNA
jgi:hypothetical protein